jgi:hypothetical protein
MTTVTANPSTAPTLTAQDTPSTPVNFVLQSFNIFNPIIAQNPNLLLNNLSNYLEAPLTDNQINSQTVSQTFLSHYTQLESSQSSYTEFAASVGISGSYGFYSGSVKASSDSKTYEVSTTFNSSYNATINFGTVAFNEPSNTQAIRACLKAQLCADLDAINSLSDAQNFTNTYGTHLVLGLNLGGCIQLKNEAQTSTYQSQLAMSLAIQASYSAAVSISATATVAENLANNSASSGLHQTIYTSGGNSSVAAAIVLGDASTLVAWANTCNANTSYGITNSIEIWELAANNTAQSFLQQYINLVIVAQSINNPTIFTAETPLVAGSLVNVQAIVNNSVGENSTFRKMMTHFRIIGGGAYLQQNVSSFLVSSYPQINDGNTNINSWQVSSHDIATEASSNNHLTAYAIAIYDPAYEAGISRGMLNIKITTANGTNPNAGSDQATIAVANGYLLAGGGIQSSTPLNVQKFIMSSCPSVDGSSWITVCSDYETAASDVTLTAYAIGIQSNNPALNIISSGVVTSEALANHGNQVANLGGGMNIMGGGVSVTNTQGGFGNLVQQSFPSSANSWTEYNKDDCGEATSANCTAYAFGFAANLNIS